MGSPSSEHSPSWAVAGLETNLVAMRSVGRAAFLAACGGVLVPFVAGAALALAAGLGPTAAVFIGAILTATSVGITAATLQELRPHGHARGDDHHRGGGHR